MSLSDYIHIKPALYTNNLILRELTIDDVDDLREWTMDESMYAYWGKRPGKTDKDPALMFASPRKPSKSFHWGIQHREDGKLIGEAFVYLIENDRMAKLAFRVSPAYQGRGCASEAVRAIVDFCFDNTELKRLWTDVDARNAASCRVLEKCGFAREGMVRQGKLVNTWCDYYLYGILNNDKRERGAYSVK